MTASPWKAGRLLALALVATFSVVACSDMPTDQRQLTPDHEATSQAAQGVGSAVAGQYIVVFEPGVTDVPGQADRLARQHGADVRFTYTAALQGFAATNLSEQGAAAIANSPLVSYVEPDRVGGIVASGTEDPATWGIDRIDQRDLPLSGTYTYNNDGSGANVYVLDTGINLSHEEFDGRAQYIPNGSNGDFVGDGHGSADDCHGHGTHVAGTSGGNTYGVAQATTLWAGRVVDCNGSGEVSMAIAGVDWITANGQTPSAVNMSLGYGDVQSLRDAVENSIAAGYNYAVAAGNGSWPLGTPQDACFESPAGAPNANTVGATDENDNEASFSNYGTCVDILAPGVSVTSADYQGGSTSMSGTSMASPHVAGAIALYLTENPSASPSQVTDALVTNASADKIALHSRSQDGGTPNLLLYTAFIGSGGDDGGTTNSPPTSSFTSSCTDLACDFDGSGSSDSDGSISSYDWDFGDGSTGTGETVSHSYAAGGTYTVTLTVTDDDGATDASSQDVSVTDPDASDITLSATGYKVRGRHHIDLEWAGATSTNVDIFRDGGLLTTTANDGFYTDATDNRGGATYTYQVCEAGTTTCSETVTVEF